MVELVTSLAILSVLVVAMGSAVVLASRGVELTATSETALATEAAGQNVGVRVRMDGQSLPGLFGGPFVAGHDDENHLRGKLGRPIGFEVGKGLVFGVDEVESVESGLA